MTERPRREKKKKLLNVIEKLTGIVVCTKDKLPKTVCRSCQKKLSNYFKFREMCINTQLDGLSANLRRKRCKELSPTATEKPRTKRRPRHEIAAAKTLSFGRSVNSLNPGVSVIGL